MTGPGPREPLPQNSEHTNAASEAEQARLRDERLDEELAETFPASDPIPAQHEPTPLTDQARSKAMNRRHPFELAVPVSPVDHILGPEHAQVTVVEYGDYECPNCKQAAPAVKLLLDHFPGSVRIVYRHFPLEEVHPHAMHAAQAAECAGAQGKFAAMHELLFANQTHLTLHHLRGYAAKLDLDMARFIAVMDDEIYLQRVREHMEGGKTSGVRATPTFFINNKIQDVSFGLHALVEGVDAALHR
jgi:protein-disulfide isomerase